MCVCSEVPKHNRLANILLVHTVAIATATVLTSSLRMRWLTGTMESSCTVKSSFTSGRSSGRMINSISALLEPGKGGEEREEGVGRRGRREGGGEGGEEVRRSEKIEGGRKREEEGREEKRR